MIGRHGSRPEAIAEPTKSDVKPPIGGSGQSLRKCELCNGQLSPKGRPHNCPGDVM